MEVISMLKSTLNPCDCEFRISHAAKGEHDAKYEYFMDEASAVARYKELLAQGFVTHIDHMDIVLGGPEYSMDDMVEI
jgi:hypothetical protein